jgi:ArsR family transcriptional regulator, arsenate/arsenite/antimonite-responsive transcriptional repressor
MVYSIHISRYMEKESAILALAALAQNTRLDTFRLLVKSEPEGVPAGELARTIGVPQNTMSAHLAILSRAGLIIGERQSRSIIYRANLKAFQDLTLFMVQDCCGGRAELCAPLLESLQPRCPPKRKSRAK